VPGPIHAADQEPSAGAVVSTSSTLIALETIINAVNLGAGLLIWRELARPGGPGTSLAASRARCA
jgi:hypothetical protein